jgi:hypothetical protein
MKAFKVNCPHCGVEQDFTNDDWNDCLVDDSQDHEMNCMHCEKEYMLRVYATYLHEALIDTQDQLMYNTVGEFDATI